jgi:outer membrane protein TolC
MQEAYATDLDALIAPTPERAWVVPDTARYAAFAAAGSDGALAPPIDPDRTYELAELIDIAQRTNPETRVAWEHAREASRQIGMAEAAYAPMLAAQAAVIASRAPFPLPTSPEFPQGVFVADTQYALPALTVKWLLFDFGGKEASVDATKEALAAANFGFNATHQKIVFDVTRAYYNLNSAQGRVDVARASLDLAQALQDVAESRRARGLATLPEALQAREKTAQASYALQESIAGVNDARIALLEAMGVGPTQPLRVGALGRRELPAMVEDTVEKLVDRAFARRPDLLAQVAMVREREADIRKAQSEFYPRIVLSGNVAQNIGRVRVTDIPGWSTVNSPGYTALLSIEVPLYDGGLRNNRVGVAQSQLRIAEEELQLARDRTARQVVKAYEGLKLALRKRDAAVALLDAANRSYDAAIDSYRNGVATFVDVTNAQTALIQARTADTDTRSSVFASAASLAFATGDLASPDASRLGAAPTLSGDAASRALRP